VGLWCWVAKRWECYTILRAMHGRLGIERWPRIPKGGEELGHSPAMRDDFQLRKLDQEEEGRPTICDARRGTDKSQADLATTHQLHRQRYQRSSRGEIGKRD